MPDDRDEDDGFYKAESLRILNPFWMQLRSHELRECGYSWEEIGKALNRHPSTIQNYFRHAERELVYQDTIHFFLSEKTRKALQKLGVDTMSFSGTDLAAEAARSYFAKKPIKGIGRATANEILDAIEDLYDSRANRRQVAGS
jgi:predicted translin family RNA/ssDNA-binding protein